MVTIETTKLGDVHVGGAFEYDNLSMIKLADVKDDNVLAVSKGITIHGIPFDNIRNLRREHNRYYGSYLANTLSEWCQHCHQMLYRVAVATAPEYDAFSEYKPAQWEVVKVRILSTNEIVRYQHLIRTFCDNPQASCWTSTPIHDVDQGKVRAAQVWHAPSGAKLAPYDFSADSPMVYKDGGVNICSWTVNLVDMNARAAFILPADIEVSAKREIAEETTQ